MLTVQSLIKTLQDGKDKVDIQLEYGPYRKVEKKKDTTELGVRFRICPPGKFGAECKYTSLHFHYSNKQSPLKDVAPEISAHFKVGQSKAAGQGFDLPSYDAYALYFLVNALQPEKEKWKPFKIRVTKQRVELIIQSNNFHQHQMVFSSKVFDLSFWDQDAWTRFLEWQVSR